MDTADIFPTVEESSFCSNFQCCGRSLKDLHELLQHYEDSHVRIEDGEDEALSAGMFDFDTVLAADSLLNVGAEASSSRPVSSNARPFGYSDMAASSASSGLITPSPSLDSRNRHGSHVKRPRILTLGIEPCDYANDDSEHCSAFDNTVIRPVDSYRDFHAYNSNHGYARIAPKRSHSVPALPNFPLINGENGFKLIHSILSSTADPPSSDNPGYHQAVPSSTQSAPSSGPLLSTYSSSSYSIGRSSNDRPFVCPVNGCGKTYKNANGLKYHAIHGHDGVLVEKPHKCPFSGCGKRYKNSNGLKYHFQHAHPNTPPPSNLAMTPPSGYSAHSHSSLSSSSSYQHQRTYTPYSSQQSLMTPVAASSSAVPPRPHSTAVPGVSNAPAAPRPTVPSQQQHQQQYQQQYQQQHQQQHHQQYQQTGPTVHPTLSAETVQNLLASAPATIANLLKNNPSLKQHLPTILRNLQQIALQKSNNISNSHSSGEEKKPYAEKPPLNNLKEGMGNK